MTSIQSNADAVNVLQRDFFTFDGAQHRSRVQEGKETALVGEDMRITTDDLHAVAYDTTGYYTPEQQAAALHILNDPELFRMLDTASGDSPTGDGRISRNDLDNASRDEFLETPERSAVELLDNPHADALGIIQEDFGVFDGAGDDGHEDGQVSVHDLASIAFGTEGDYTLEQRAAARYLLDNMQVFNALDADRDGLFRIEDVETAALQPTPAADGHAQPASLDLDGDGRVSDAEAQTGAETLGPILYMDPEDGFLLTDPEAYIEGSYVTDEHGNFIRNPVEWMRQNPGKPLIIDPGRYVISSMDDYAGTGIFVAEGNPGARLVEDPEAYLAENPGAVLTVIPRGSVVEDTTAFAETGNYYAAADGTAVSDPAAYLAAYPEAELYYDPGSTSNPVPDATKTYYEYDPASNSITYYYFYPNNDGPAGVGDVQNHEGDWEHVTIQLDDGFRPATVYYSAHGDNSGVPWNQVLKEDGRPVVFVATGSHANYFLPGDDHPTKAPLVHDSTVGSTAEGLRFDTRTTALTAIDRENPPWWYDDNVRWGEQRWHKDLSGPPGPHPKKIQLP